MCVKEWAKAEREITAVENTDNFLLGAQHAQLAKADVKGGTLERSIRLPHHNDVDPSGKSGRVKATVQLLHCHKHCLCQLAHNIHGLGLKQKNKKWERCLHSLFSAVCGLILHPLFPQCQQHLKTISSIYSKYKSCYYRITTSHSSHPINQTKKQMTFKKAY